MNNNSKTNIYFSLNLRGYWSSPVQYGHVTMFRASQYSLMKTVIVILIELNQAGMI